MHYLSFVNVCDNSRVLYCKNAVHHAIGRRIEVLIMKWLKHKRELGSLSQGLTILDEQYRHWNHGKGEEAKQ